MLLTDARVAVPAGVLEPGWIRVEGARISEVGAEAAPDAAPADVERLSLAGRTVVPGFVDLHLHGGGGHSMQSADADKIRAAAAFHLEHGTTRLLVSIVTAPLDAMLATLGVVSRLAGEGTILGAHLEGPFLSPVRAGAHDARHLLAPDAATFERLLAAADGALRVATVAPELPGGIELLRRVVASGAVAAVGHSDADHAGGMAAFDAGATLVTHLFNGMRPWHHREPGLAGAALERPDVVCELIADGVHLHDASARLAFVAAPGRIALVTDATAAAGSAEGAHRLGTAEVRVRDGAPRLADGVTLAGSVLTMDRALARAVQELGLPIGTAVEAASTTPARVLGIGDRVGSIEPGKDADLVVLDDDLRVEAVMSRGVWITSGRLFHT
jgi:N-acetylglucosamine-6-phosphate deacetylase